MLVPAAVALDVAVVIPCLNEVRTIGQVVADSHRALTELGRSFEIVVADNGSSDGSQEAATKAGARVVDARSHKGVGAATRFGAEASLGKILVFLDADGEHNPAEIPSLVQAVEGRPEALVLGSRYLGKFEKGASSLPNRLLGTPALTFMLNHYFGTKITDCNTGFRAMTRPVFDRIDVRTPGFEFCSEMIARAALVDVPVIEVPIVQRPGPPGRRPHLRRLRDGWRHLRLILLHAPDRVLLRPGFVALFLGALLFVPQVFGRVEIGPLVMDIHLMILGALLLFIGVEMIGAAIVCATIAGEPVAPASRTSRRLGQHFSLDSMLGIAGLLLLLGVAADVAVVVISGLQGWQGLTAPRLALLGTTGIGLSIQLLVLSFVHSVVGQYPRAPISAP